MSNSKSTTQWIVVLARLTMAVVFGVAAINKFTGGLDDLIAVFIEVFEGSWLPTPLVEITALAIPFAEAFIAIWLLVGIRLKLAWIVSGLIMVMLTFGISVARKYSVAADNVIYLIVILIGMYFTDLQDSEI